MKDFSLSGGYRKLVAKPAPRMTFEIKVYSDENERLVDTDLVQVQMAESKPDGNADLVSREAEEQPERMAVVLKLQLPSSTYAIMALREMMKDGVKSCPADFGMRRN